MYADIFLKTILSCSESKYNGNRQHLALTQMTDDYNWLWFGPVNRIPPTPKQNHPQFNQQQQPTFICMPPTATPPPDYATESTLLKNKINQLIAITATAVEKITHAITSLHTIQDTPATNDMTLMTNVQLHLTSVTLPHLTFLQSSKKLKMTLLQSPKQPKPCFNNKCHQNWIPAPVNLQSPEYCEPVWVFLVNLGFKR